MMWQAVGFGVVYILLSFIGDVAAKVCAQYRGYNGAIIYMNCYGDCCGDWNYRYCCASSTVNLYAVCAGLTLLGIVIILIIAVCCRYMKRRSRRNQNNRGNRNDVSAITQSAIYSEPPAYSPHDPYQGYSNPVFPEVVTDYEYMKPPDYQKDPPEYEKDPPTYYTAVSGSNTDTEVCGNSGNNVDSSENNPVATNASSNVR